jgi:hypothetical protein
MTFERDYAIGKVAAHFHDSSVQGVRGDPRKHLINVPDKQKWLSFAEKGPKAVSLRIMQRIASNLRLLATLSW